MKICFLFCRRAVWPVPDSNRGTVCIRRGHTLDRNHHGPGRGYHLRYRGIHTHRPHHCNNRVLVLSTTSTTVKVITYGVWHEREFLLKFVQQRNCSQVQIPDTRNLQNGQNHRSNFLWKVVLIVLGHFYNEDHLHVEMSQRICNVFVLISHNCQ